MEWDPFVDERLSFYGFNHLYDCFDQIIIFNHLNDQFYQSILS